jgi:integrase
MYKVWKPKGARVYYARVNGRRISTHCSDKGAADAFARDLERRDADPNYRSANEATLAVAIKAMLAAKARDGRAKGTIDMYETKTAHLARVLGPSTPLAALSAPMVDHFLDTRLAEGASRNTISKELVALSQTLRIARRAGLFPTDPRSILPVAWDAGYKPRRRHLESLEDAHALLAEFPPDRAAHLAFFLATAARDAEATRARAEDIRFDEKLVHIRGTKTDLSDVDIPIIAVTRPLLERALRDAPGTSSGRLFRPWSNVRRDLCLAGQRVGLGKLSPNDLRRTLATWLVNAGVPLYLVAKLLRHADTRMVERVYGKASATSVGNLIDGATAFAPKAVAKKAKATSRTKKVRQG